MRIRETGSFLSPSPSLLSGFSTQLTFSLNFIFYHQFLKVTCKMKTQPYHHRLHWRTLSTQETEEATPKLLQQMSSPPPKKRKAKSTSESNRLWTPSREEKHPDFKHPHLSLMSWTNGQGSLIVKEEMSLTLTSQKLTRPLSSLKPASAQMPKDLEPPCLLERLTSPNLCTKGDEMRWRNSLTESPGVNLKRTEKHRWSDIESGRTRCPGIIQQPIPPAEAAVSKPVELCVSLAKTLLGSSPCYASPTTFRKESPPPSGIESSRASLLTSIKSSPPCILSRLMKREREVWEQLKSCLSLQSPSVRSKRGLNGRLPIGGLPRPLLSSSLTEGKNCPSTQNTLKDCFQPSTQGPTQRSSYTTSQFETRLEEGKTSSLPITSGSTVLEKQSSMPMGLNTYSLGEEDPQASGAHHPKWGVDLEKGEGWKKIIAAVSTVPRAANLTKKIATTGISVMGVAREDMASPPVLKSNDRLVHGLTPKYLRYNIWDLESDFTPNTADWTETALPLEGPPPDELENAEVTKTLEEHPKLFQIVTPIQVEVLETYLVTHPNPAFVTLVCRGLREGFWPWASTTKPGYLSTNDESRPPPTDMGKAAFLRKQCDVEVAKERFSPPFKQGLLPRMYSMPIYAVPKPDATDYHLVTDQSCGKFSLNSMIMHTKVTGYPFDNMVHFGEMLMDLERREPGKQHVVWKSDIVEAYRIIPMHPHWQIKQINTIDGVHHID